jgi:hypothetical protein
MLEDVHETVSKNGGFGFKLVGAVSITCNAFVRDVAQTLEAHCSETDRTCGLQLA